MKNLEKDFKLFARDKGVSSMTLDGYKGFVMNNKFNPTSMINLPTSMTPYIVEERTNNMTQMDVFSRLMQERILFIGTGISSEVANIVNAQLLFLESVDSKKDIHIYINCNGGSCIDGMAIINIFDFIKPDIATVVTGLAASMGYVISTSGTKGKRSALKNSRLMQHQVSSGSQGVYSDMEIALIEMARTKKELYTKISENTGQTYEKIEKDCDRDYWMSAEEARSYGAIDYVIGVK